MLFQRFDRLLLLAKGGKTIYFGDIGENSSTVTKYFADNGARTCSQGENPAEWMLEVTGAAPGSSTDRDWHETWRSSREYQEIQSTLDDMQHTLVPVENTSASLTAFATPFWFQTLVVSKRVFEQYWRTPSYIYSKLFLSVSSVSRQQREFKVDQLMVF
jgi:ATP-binding cassette, subfamily G (WHITE), member 2, PDR